MIRSIGVATPVMPRRDSGKGKREEQEPSADDDDQPRRDPGAGPSDAGADGDAPQPPHHIDDYA